MAHANDIPETISQNQHTSVAWECVWCREYKHPMCDSGVEYRCVLIIPHQHNTRHEPARCYLPPPRLSCPGENWGIRDAVVPLSGHQQYGGGLLYWRRFCWALVSVIEVEL